jgi:glycosyltransferase involved in cell wall biosynthesis
LRYSIDLCDERRIRVLSIMEADFVTGPAKNLIEFAQRAREKKEGRPAVELSVAGYRRGDDAESAFVQAARRAGLTMDVIHESGRFDSSVVGQIKRIVAARNPDIVQTHNVKSHFFLRWSGVWHERAWLAFHHGYTAEDFKMRCYNAANRWSLRAARHVVTVCGPFVEQLVRQGVRRESITVLHNSVQPYQTARPAAIHEARALVPAPEGTPIIVSIGRLSREKGHVDLLGALAMVRTAGVAFHAVFVGEGVERERIEAVRARLGLQKQVTLAGLQHDVRPYYAMAQIAVMASHSEGSPNALLEAMAAGLPIVATRAGGIPEIATHEETALLVETRQPKAIAQAIQRLLEDPALRERLSTQAKSAAECYSPDAYRRSLTTIYERVLGSTAKGGRC